MYYLYYNGHGDLAAEADGSGTRTASHTYDAFGAPVDAPPANATSHRFTGAWNKQDDTTTGLILMGARPYDPNLGRFYAVDPIDGGSLNNYDYAAQDPINKYDLGGTEYHAMLGFGPGFAESVDDARSGYITAADQARKYGIKNPYVRPSSARAKPAESAAVQGEPCSTCGRIAPKMYVNHEPPLVKQYYEHGGINLDTTLRTPHCPTCSARQGGYYSAYSRGIKGILFGGPR